MNQEPVVPSRQELAPKKVYESPRLTEYGSVAKLTRHNAASPTSDSGSNGMSPMAPCL